MRQASAHNYVIPYSIIKFCQHWFMSLPNSVMTYVQLDLLEQICPSIRVCLGANNPKWYGYKQPAPDNSKFQ